MKMIKKVNIIIGIIIISSIIFVKIIVNDNLILLKDEFIIDFNGSILSVEVVIITFMYSSLDRITDYIKKLDINDSKKNRIESLLYSSIRELIDNGKIVFYIFVFNIILIIIRSIDIVPNNYIVMINKTDLINFLKIFGFLLILYAVYDSLEVLFNLIKMSLIINDKSKTLIS